MIKGLAMRRREFLYSLAALSSTFALSSKVFSSPRPHVVVIGGGFSGSTCAKYLKLWGGKSVEVTLIDEDRKYISPILSNLVLVDIKNLKDLTFYHEALRKYGVNVIYQKAVDVDTEKKLVTLANGKKISYDKLVLAGGINFKFTNKYSTEKVPHAWIAGKQTLILREKIHKLRDGDTFLMSIPKKPYRCPPGPYERACVVSDFLRRKGIKAKVIVLDENPDIIVERETFKKMFRKYGIDYRPNTKVTYVSDTNMEVAVLEKGKKRVFKAQVLNIIPNQKAADIVFTAKVNRGDFAPVDPIDYQSTVVKDVHIIGDSQGTSQPKAGHIGNSEAKVCADAILRELSGNKPYPNPKTNSACYSPVSNREATWLTAVFKYDPEKKDMVLVNKHFPAASPPSRKNFKEMFYWAGNLFYDTFG